MSIDNICGVEIIYNNINTKKSCGLFEMHILDSIKEELQESRTTIAILKNTLNKYEAQTNDTN